MRNTKIQRQLKRRIPEASRYHASLSQHPQIAVGKLTQFFSPRYQVIGRSTLRNHQAQHVLVEERLLSKSVSLPKSRVEDVIGFVEVQAIPCPQAVSDPVRFSETCGC